MWPLSTRCVYLGFVVQPHAGLSAAVNHVHGYDGHHTTHLEQRCSCGAKVGTKEYSLASYAISDCNIARDRKLLKFAATSRGEVATDIVFVHDVLCKLFMAVLYRTACLSSRKLLFPLTQ